MTDKISRREFIKLAGMGAAATMAMTGCGPASRYVVREQYPKMPEYTYSGQNTYYASTCRECPAGCGIVVKTFQGRAIKIEGNDQNPVNLGKTCPRGQAALQGLYNPDRIQNPIKRPGRNNGNLARVSWDDAITTVKDALTNNQPGEIAFLMGMVPDHLFDLVSEITSSLGSPAPLRYSAHEIFDARRTLVEASRLVFADPSLPYFDLGNATVVFSFGANFLEAYLSPLAYARGYAVMRQGHPTRRPIFIQFEPRMSQTAASSIQRRAQTARAALPPLAATVAPAATPAPVTQSGDPARDATTAAVNLHAGYIMDPYLVPVIGKSEKAAADLQGGCNGYVSATPNVVVNWAGVTDRLSFFIYSDGDAALVVQGPDGSSPVQRRRRVERHRSAGEDRQPGARQLQGLAGTAAKDAPALGFLAVTQADLDDAKLAELDLTSILRRRERPRLQALPQLDPQTLPAGRPPIFGAAELRRASSRCRFSWPAAAISRHSGWRTRRWPAPASSSAAPSYSFTWRASRKRSACISRRRGIAPWPS